MHHYLWVTIAFACYFVGVGLLGLRAYRQTTNAAGFLLGERRLSYWVTALSAGASDMSGWLLLGLPGLAYSALVESVWVAIGLFLGVSAAWLFVARPLREQSERFGNALTIPEFFANRFNGNTRLLRTISALLILLFFAFYTAAGLIAGGKLFAAAFDTPYAYAVSASAAIIVLYTTFGGFLAVAWTDALQAVLMLLALVVVASLAILHANGLPPEMQIASNTTAMSSAPVSGFVIASSLAWGLGYCGQPHILARFMAIKNAKDISSAGRLAIVWSATALCAAIVVGFAGSELLGEAGALSDKETIFIQLIEILLHPIVAGICFAAILAAIMSTADSQLLIAAAALTHDLIPHLGKHPSAALPSHRLAVVGISCFALLLALRPNTGVLSTVAYAWGGLGATLGPALLMSLHAPHTTHRSALAGMLAGACTLVAWEYLSGGIFDVYALLPGFCCGLVVISCVNHFCE